MTLQYTVGKTSNTYTHKITFYKNENLQNFLSVRDRKQEPFEAINLHKVSIFHSDCDVATDFAFILKSFAFCSST